jgi:Tfp pilus assembly protein PilF
MKEAGFKALRGLFLALSVFLCIRAFFLIRDFPKTGRSYLGRDNVVSIKGRFLSRDKDVYPEELVAFLKQVRLPERVFNNFNMGAPLIFNFFPRRKVFIDGRAELYGKEFFSLYRDAVAAKPQSLDQIINRYELEGFIIGYIRETPFDLIKLLPERGFESVYFGRDGIVFISRDFLNQNQALKEKVIDFSGFKIEKIDLLKEIKLNLPMMEGHFRRAYVLEMLGYSRKAEEYFKEIIKVAPNHARSHYHLALIYYKNGRYEQSFSQCRKSLIFDPGLKKAKRLLAKVYIKTGDTDAARQLLEKLDISYDKISAEVNNEQ